jgi:hypothetical protein
MASDIPLNRNSGLVRLVLLIFMLTQTLISIELLSIVLPEPMLSTIDNRDRDIKKQKQKQKQRQRLKNVNQGRSEGKQISMFAYLN